MTVQLLDTTEKLTALSDEWNRLAAGHAMRGCDWLTSWREHYDPSGELMTLAVRDGERLVGLAPWRLERSVRCGAAVRWLGDGEACTDHLTLLCEEGFEERVADKIAGYLVDEHDGWDLLQLDDCDAEDPRLKKLTDALERRGCTIRHREAGRFWSIELPSDWDEFLARLSKSHRKQIRRAERNVLEAQDCRWTTVQTLGDWEHAWPIFVDLHQRRWQSQGEPGCFASPRFEAFHRDVSRRLLDRGEMRLSWLEINGRPAAAEYDFIGGRSVLAYQGGVEPELLEEQAGRMLNILAIRSAIEDGFAVFDFLRGDEPYKAHWRAEPHATAHLQAVPPRRSAQWRAGANQLLGAVGNQLKALRPR